MMLNNVYLSFLLISSALTAKVVMQVDATQTSSLLELGVGIGAAVLIIREVFNFLRAQAEDRKHAREDTQQQEIRDLLWKIDQRLKNYHDED